MLPAAGTARETHTHTHTHTARTNRAREALEDSRAVSRPANAKLTTTHPRVAPLVPELWVTRREWDRPVVTSLLRVHCCVTL